MELLTEGGPRVRVGWRVTIDLCREHAKQVLHLVSDGLPAGRHDNMCELCSSGLGTQEFTARLSALGAAHVKAATGYRMEAADALLGLIDELTLADALPSPARG